MIYLDNSASTLIKPKEVVKAVTDALIKYPANPGRSGHKESIKAAMVVSDVRNKVKNFIGLDKAERVIFTQNCTDALNLAILGSAKQGGHIICTINDHNSMLRPIFELKNKGIVDVSVASPKNMAIITREDIEHLINENTYMICANHLSNVDGAICDIASIGELCAEKDILFLVDAAQSAGHIKLDMLKNHIDLLTLAPHKGLYSPQGIGVLGIGARAKVKPIRFGGTGTDSFNLLQPTELPEMYESGTISTPNISGLGEGINFVNENFARITEKMEDYTTYLNYELTRIGCKVYTSPDNAYGVLAFNIDDIDSRAVANYLDEHFNICVRAGAHCAPLKHDFLGTTEQGAVRVSLSYFNNFSEMEKLVHAVKSCMKNI